MAQRRHSLANDDDVALHPMVRRQVVAVVLLSIGLIALLWPASRNVKPSFASTCERLDQSPSGATARLIQGRDEAAEARINEAVLGPRDNCR